MNFRIHNTFTGKKEDFVPQHPDRVTLYVCGPTVYNRVHIGNARPAVIFDTLYRLLNILYGEVIYARNITDIDDKINKAAEEQGVAISVITEKFTEAYLADMAGLGVLEPVIQPKATDHIEEIINIISELVARGHAYESEGHVLFHVPSMKDYGALSGRNVDDMLAGARVEVASYKKDPMDFVLWKPSTGNLPGWESPWGWGRPGWHIECTAMINKHLGATIDIHGGGSDLIFPHHENERAQGICSHGPEESYVRYWMHNGMINIDGEKMSKSLNNFITVRELLDQYPGEQLRYALLSGHYRSVLSFGDDLLTQSKAGLDRFYGALRETQSITADLPANPAESRVAQALADDLNTPEALAALHGLASELFKEKNPDKVARLKGELIFGGHLLGILEQSPDEWFTQGSANAITAENIEGLIAERADAKKNKDFARSDQIRQDLLDQGVEIQDTREGTRWQRV